MVVDGQSRMSGDVGRPVRPQGDCGRISGARSGPGQFPGRGLRPMRGIGMRLYDQRRPGLGFLYAAFFRSGAKRRRPLQLYRSADRAAAGIEGWISELVCARVKTMVAKDLVRIAAE